MGCIRQAMRGKLCDNHFSFVHLAGVGFFKAFTLANIYPSYAEWQRRNLEVSMVTFRSTCHDDMANWQSEGKSEAE